MNQWDDVQLQEMREEEQRLNAARKRKQMIGLVVGGLLAVALVVLTIMSRIAAANAGHELHFFGQHDTDVRVEIEGEETFVIPTNGYHRIRPSRPGTHHLKITALESNTTHELELEVPGPDPEGEAVLAVPTKAGECFVAFDVSTWYSGSATLLEIAADRADGVAPKGSGQSLPRPIVVSRMNTLDPLPSRFIHRYWALPSLADPGETVLVVLETECAALTDSDGEHIARLLEAMTR